MRWLLAFLTACFTSRLAPLDDPQLRTADHGKTFVLSDGDRVEPDSLVRFRRGERDWSDAHLARDLHIDADGVSIDGQVHFLEGADAIEIEGVTHEVAAMIMRTRPPEAKLTVEPGRYRLEGDWPTLIRWTTDLEVAVAGGEMNVDHLRYGLYEDGLGTWHVHTVAGELPPITGIALARALDWGRDARVGWRWRDMTAVEVTNLSGIKTLGAIIGYTALIVALLPVGALHGGGGGDIKMNTPPKGTWDPELSHDPGAPALFSTGARVRSIVDGTLSLDASVSHDLIGTGAVARVQLGGVVELGGGVRVDDVRGHGLSTTGLFQANLLFPLDARGRFSLPLGVEIGGGGEVGHDLRLPWGLRVDAGRWFATFEPATADHVRLAGQRSGRWSLTSGAEVGVRF